MRLLCILFCLLLLPLVYAVNFTADNIEAFYPLDSTYQATDYYGVHDCTNNGATFGTDGADLENSESDFINCTATPMSDAEDKTFTISAMFNIETGCNCAMAIISKENRISPTRHMFDLEPFQDVNNNLYFYVWDDTDASYTGKQRGSKPTEGVWHHVIATYNDTDQSTTLYFNGDYLGTSFNSGTMTGITDQTADVLIGAMIQVGTGLDRHFDGKIANLTILNDYVMTAAEVNDTKDVNGWIPTLIPVLDFTQASWNITSGINAANQTAWASDESLIPIITDPTPSVLLETTLTSNCSISIYALNYSDSISNNSDTECSTSETTSHTATLPSDEYLTVGQHEITIAALDTSTEDNVSRTFSVELQNSPPTFNETYLLIISHGDGFSLTGNWSDVNIEQGANVYVNDTTLTVTNTDNTSRTFQMSWNPTLNDAGKNWSFELSIEDEGTEYNLTKLNISIYVNNTPPTFNETFTDQLIYNKVALNITGNWSDNESDDAQVSVNGTRLQVSITDNTTRTYELYWNATDSDVETNWSFELTITDGLQSSSQIFSIYVLNSTIVTAGANYTNIVPATNLSRGTINITLLTYTELNVSMENMTESNPLYNISTALPLGQTLNMTLNETFLDFIVGCSCSYNYSSKVNLTNLTQTICSIQALGYVDLWCWADFINFNFTTERNLTMNFTLEVYSS